jgi:hypothetical protein
MERELQQLSALAEELKREQVGARTSVLGIYHDQNRGGG